MSARLFSRIRPYRLLAAAALLVACGGPLGPGEEIESIYSDDYETFTLDGLRSQRAAQGTSYFQAILRPTFQMGILRGEVGQTGSLITYGDNAIYYVAAGAGEVMVEGTIHTFSSGDLLFVRAGAEHQFRSITATMDAISIIAIDVPGPGDPEFARITAAEIVAGRDGADNVFEQLLLTSTLGIGAYMLPKELTGDQVQRHQFDEFKLIMAGAGRVDLEQGGTDVVAGSVAFIGKEVGHQFRRISEDLDILVIWRR